jgi:cell division protein FtsL
MNPFSLLNRRVRGFLVIELVATALLTIVVLVVYLAKTGAGDKRDDIVRVEQQIETESAQIRLLRAEVASEERPERLEALAGQYLGLQPVTAKHEIDPEALADIAQLGKAAPDAKSKLALAAPAPAAPGLATPHVTPVAAPAAPAAPTLQHAAYVTGADQAAAKAQR